jgi:hypothetical protein
MMQQQHTTMSFHSHMQVHSYLTLHFFLVVELLVPEIFFATVGKYYLVDSGYPNQLGYLTPYKGTKYHLQEYRDMREP